MPHFYALIARNRGQKHNSVEGNSYFAYTSVFQFKNISFHADLKTQ